MTGREAATGTQGAVTVQRHFADSILCGTLRRNRHSTSGLAAISCRRGGVYLHAQCMNSREHDPDSFCRHKGVFLAPC